MVDLKTRCSHPFECGNFWGQTDCSWDEVLLEWDDNTGKRAKI